MEKTTRRAASAEHGKCPVSPARVDGERSSGSGTRFVLPIHWLLLAVHVGCVAAPSACASCRSDSACRGCRPDRWRDSARRCQVGGDPDRVALHGLRDGRLAARAPIGYRAVMRVRPEPRRPAGRGRRLLRRAAPPRRTRGRKPRRSRDGSSCSMPGTAPVVVNSAGCGAAMKDYGALLGTPAAEAFSARVRDFSEWVVDQAPPPCRADRRAPSWCKTRATSATCRSSTARCVPCLTPAYTLVETDDDGLCCGAGGAYAGDSARASRPHPIARPPRCARPDAPAIRSSCRPTPAACCHLRQARARRPPSRRPAAAARRSSMN